LLRNRPELGNDPAISSWMQKVLLLSETMQSVLQGSKAGLLPPTSDLQHMQLAPPASEHSPSPLPEASAVTADAAVPEGLPVDDSSSLSHQLLICL
jgi:hypothetical protein